MFAEAYRTEDGVISLELHGDLEGRSYEIFQHPLPEPCVDPLHLLARGGGNVTRIVGAPESLPAYFTIRFDDGETLVAGYRIVPLAGMYNFRDMGGYPTEDGRRVRWGRLYRGDQLYNMKEEAYESFRSLQIRSIIDFRGTREYEANPNIPAELYQIPQYHLVPEGENAALAGDLSTESSQEKRFDIERIARALEKDPDYAGKPMIDQQIGFVTNPDSLAAFRDSILLMAEEENLPTFFHCRGGKDRTGYAAMLVLALLGVSEDVIMYDYMLTKRARENKNQLYLERFRKIAKGDEAIAQVLLSYFDTKEEYLQAALDEIHRSSGCVRNYVTSTMGVDSQVIDRLRGLYLE